MPNKKVTLPLTLMRLAKKVSVAILFLQQLQFGAVAFGQTLSVNGNVLNDKGTPVAGAAVVQKGTTYGTVSGKNRECSMQVASRAAFEISPVGHCKKEVNVIGSLDITTEILSDDKILGEIVVTVYVIQKKIDIGDDVSGDDPVSSGLLIGKPIDTIYDYEPGGIYQLNDPRLPGFQIESGRPKLANISINRI